MFRTLGQLVSPAGEHAKLCVLMYHRVLPQPDPILAGEIDAELFEQHMRLLATEFNVLPLSEGCARLVAGSLPARAAAITFDDGYSDNEQVALPILRRLGLSATFFVSTGYSDGGVMFNDGVIEAVREAPAGEYDFTEQGLGRHVLDGSESRRLAIDRILRGLVHRAAAERRAIMERLLAEMDAALPKDLMMTPAQIAHLHREGMEIGGHTISHPILHLLDESQARAEIVGGKRRLEEITGAPVTLFAYPNGKPGEDYGLREVRLVQEAGFAAAVSTILGVAHRGSDPFQLPRYAAWERNQTRLGVRLLLHCARTASQPTSAPSSLRTS